MSSISLRALLALALTTVITALPLTGPATARAEEAGIGPAAAAAPTASASPAPVPVSTPPPTKTKPDAALSPAPATIPAKGQKPESNIEIAGPDNGGEAQLYKLPGGARLVTCIVRLSNKVVTGKSYFAKDGSGWIVYEEKAYFYDEKKGTLHMDKFGDKNTACLTFDTEKRVTTAAMEGDSFPTFAGTDATTAKKPALDADSQKQLEQQLIDAATEARQFTTGTVLPYMEAHKTGTLTLED